MRYSVVVLFYHHNPKLTEIAKECIESIRLNSQDYELIIVDNNSKEDVSWAKPDVYVKFSENKGIAPAWNTGIKLARGKYIAICNDDIVVYPGWLEAMEKAVKATGGDGVGACHVEHLPYFNGMRENYKWFPGSCFMLTQETVKRVGYFDEQFVPCNFEDTDYWTRVVQAGAKMFVNYEVTVDHKEGQTLHIKELTEPFEHLKQLYIQKHGFNPIPYFYYDGDINEVRNFKKPNL